MNPPKPSGAYLAASTREAKLAASVHDPLSSREGPSGNITRAREQRSFLKVEGGIQRGRGFFMAQMITFELGRSKDTGTGQVNTSPSTGKAIQGHP